MYVCIYIRIYPFAVYQTLYRNRIIDLEKRAFSIILSFCTNIILTHTQTHTHINLEDETEYNTIHRTTRLIIRRDVKTT